MRKFWHLSSAERGLLLKAGMLLACIGSLCGCCHGIASPSRDRRPANRAPTDPALNVWSGRSAPLAGWFRSPPA